MSKETRSFTVDEEVDEWLESTNLNASALVNDLLKQYMKSGGSMDNILEFRRRQVESEYKDLASRAATKLEELNELEEQIEEQQQRYRNEIEEVAEEAVRETGISPENGHDHAMAETWAGKAGVSPEEFWEIYTEKYYEINPEEKPGDN